MAASTYGPGRLAMCAALVAIGLLNTACATDWRGVGTGPGAPAAEVPLLDIDGYELLADGVAIAEQPSPSEIEQAAARGYRTVVNFRTAPEGAGEEGHLVRAAGMAYHNIPVAPPDVAWTHADQLARVLRAPGARPALLHCKARDRAAAVWALYLARHEGVGAADALAAAERAGLSHAKVRAAAERELGLLVE